MQETQEMLVWYLGQEDPLEEEMATHPSIFAWKIPWTEDPGGLQSMGSKRVKHDWATEHKMSYCGIIWWLLSVSKYFICFIPKDGSFYAFT